MNSGSPMVWSRDASIVAGRSFGRSGVKGWSRPTLAGWNSGVAVRELCDLSVTDPLCLGDGRGLVLVSPVYQTTMRLG